MVTCKLTSYYSCKDERPYCAMLRKMFKVEFYLRNAVHAQLGGGGKALFWKSKNVHWFWEKDPDFAHLWLKFSIQGVPLRVSRRKKTQFFPSRAFLSCAFERNIYQSAPISRNLSCPQKFLVARLSCYHEVPLTRAKSLQDKLHMLQTTWVLKIS